MKVTLIIPTLNEAGCIGKVLREVPGKLVNEIIIVDGHSSDETIAKAKITLTKRDKIIHQKSYGYGGAFLEGFPHATGDVIIMMDADGSQNPQDIPKLLAKIKIGFEYVMASRYISGGGSDDDTWLRRFGNLLFTWMTNQIHGTNVTDSLYLFTAITRNGLDRLHLISTGFEFCTEIIVKAHRSGLKFAEVPVIERPRISGKSKVNSFWHGLKILRMILRRFKS